MKIALSSNSMWNLYNFRYGLIKKLVKDGHKIIIVAPQDSSLSDLIKLGCKIKKINIDNK